MSKVLRAYQRDAFVKLKSWIDGGERDLLLESPVGSGKTTTVKALAAAFLRDGGRVVVVLVPQLLLRNQWADAGSWRVGRASYSLPEAEVVEGRTMAPSWWRSAAGVFVTTRQGFARQQTGRALAGCLIVADEGHHCADTTAGARAIAAARERGAVTLLVSATPWATAGEVGSATTKAHRLSDAEYVTAFDADDPSRPPAEYAVDIVRVGAPTAVPTRRRDDSNGATRTAGPATPAEEAHARKICAAMARRWAADGFPRTVMNVPRVFWGEYLRRALVRARKPAHGGVPVVLDLIGDEVDAEAHARLMADSQAARWADVKINVVMSCARMDEGLDWVPCSHVYNAGIPSVPGLILQRWGRAARGKRRIAGYPEEHARARTLVFFTPPGKGTDKGWGPQIETAWILAGCIADYRVMRDWIEERKARGERGPLPVPLTSPAIAEWTGRLAAHVAARGGELAPADARAWLAAKGVAVEVSNAVVRRMQAADARHRAAEEASFGLKVRADRKADAAALIDEFSSPLRSANIVTTMVRLTALDAKELENRMRQIVPWDGLDADRMISFAKKASDEFARRTGERLTAASGACHELNGRTGGGLDMALREVGSSLSKAQGVRLRDMHKEELLSFSRAQISSFMGIHHKPPTVTSGSVCGNMTWNALNQALNKHGTSVSELAEGGVSRRERAARSVLQWISLHGAPPRECSKIEEERKVGRVRAHLRRVAPEWCDSVGIFAVDQSQAGRRAAKTRWSK
jgi:energy-coupling factor transporter ATP-binding protein EcfA2